MDEEKEKSEKKNETYTELSIHKTIAENPDSLELGTPSKGGAIKVYGNFADKEAFKKKIDAAKEVRDDAQANVSVNT